MAPFDKLRAHSGRQAPVILKPMISGLIAGQMIRSGHFYGHRTATRPFRSWMAAQQNPSARRTQRHTSALLPRWTSLTKLILMERGPGGPETAPQ